MSTITQKKDRVKESTPSSINKKIENNTWQDVSEYLSKGKPQITRRIHELEKEWDIERYLGVNMSTVAMIGIVLSYFVNIYWLLLPAAALIFFFQHSVQGWCPPLPIMRLFNVRTRKEIEQEKYALKVIRGDFENLEKISQQNIHILKQAVKLS